jgi:hypothetical protein
MLPDRRSRGVALLLALLVLAVAGSFLVAGFYAARTAGDVDLVSLRAVQLDAANDVAAVSLLSTWDSAARFRQARATTAAVTASAGDAAISSSAWLTRLSAATYLATLRSSEMSGTLLASRASVLLHVDAPVFPPMGVLVADGDVVVKGGLRASLPLPGALAACGDSLVDSLPVTVPPGGHAPGPHESRAAAGDDSTYRVFGPVTVDALAARGGGRLSPVGSTPAPTGTIMVAPGDLDISGGQGRGLLIVQGDLRLTGAVTFRGVIVALGLVTVDSGTVLIDGLLLAHGTGAAAVSVNAFGDLILHSDPCLIDDVAWHAGRPQLLARRGWMPVP